MTFSSKPPVTLSCPVSYGEQMRQHMIRTGLHHSLNLSFNQFPTRVVFRNILNWLPKGIHHLQLNNMGISTLHLEEIKDQLGEGNKLGELQELHLDNNNLADIDDGMLREFFTDLSIFLRGGRSISLKGTGLTKDRLISLSNTFCGTQFFIYIDSGRLEFNGSKCTFSPVGSSLTSFSPLRLMDPIPYERQFALAMHQETLNLSTNQLARHNFEDLLDALPSGIQCFKLNNTGFTTEHICLMLSRFKKIERVRRHTRNNTLEATQATLDENRLNRLGGVKELHLEHNDFSKIENAILNRFFAIFPYLERLYLNNTGLTEERVVAFGTILQGRMAPSLEVFVNNKMIRFDRDGSYTVLPSHEESMKVIISPSVTPSISSSSLPGMVSSSSPAPKTRTAEEIQNIDLSPLNSKELQNELNSLLITSDTLRLIFRNFDPDKPLGGLEAHQITAFNALPLSVNKIILKKDNNDNANDVVFRRFSVSGAFIFIHPSPKATPKSPGSQPGPLRLFPSASELRTSEKRQPRPGTPITSSVVDTNELASPILPALTIPSNLSPGHYSEPLYGRRSGKKSPVNDDTGSPPSLSPTSASLFPSMARRRRFLADNMSTTSVSFNSTDSTSLSPARLPLSPTPYSFHNISERRLTPSDKLSSSSSSNESTGLFSLSSPSNSSKVATSKVSSTTSPSKEVSSTSPVSPAENSSVQSIYGFMRSRAKQEATPTSTEKPSL